MILNRFTDRMLLEILPPSQVEVFLRQNDFPLPQRFEYNAESKCLRIMWIFLTNRGEDVTEFILEWDLRQDSLSYSQRDSHYMTGHSDMGEKRWLERLANYHSDNIDKPEPTTGVSLPYDLFMTLKQAVQDHYT